jgi:hypothetical protein
MIGDIWTDSGFLAGIGGCPTQHLAAQFASTTRTYFYQFDDLHAPGLNNDNPGYQWGAGHAMELAYLWPSFNNGFSLYDLLTPGAHPPGRTGQAAPDVDAAGRKADTPPSLSGTTAYGSSA